MTALKKAAIAPRDEKMTELSQSEVQAVSGGECTTTYGTCKEVSPGHVVCSETVTVCK